MSFVEVGRVNAIYVCYQGTYMCAIQHSVGSEFSLYNYMRLVLQAETRFCMTLMGDCAMLYMCTGSAFIQGINYACASEVPVQYRRAAFSSVMSTVAKLHAYHWVYTVNDRKIEYLDSAPFFQDQVLCIWFTLSLIFFC